MYDDVPRSDPLPPESGGKGDARLIGFLRPSWSEYFNQLLVHLGLTETQAAARLERLEPERGANPKPLLHAWRWRRRLPTHDTERYPVLLAGCLQWEATHQGRTVLRLIVSRNPRHMPQSFLPSWAHQVRSTLAQGRIAIKNAERASRWRIRQDTFHSWIFGRKPHARLTSRITLADMARAHGVSPLCWASRERTGIFYRYCWSDLRFLTTLVTSAPPNPTSPSPEERSRP